MLEFFRESECWPSWSGSLKQILGRSGLRNRTYMLVAKSLLSWGKTSSLYDILENGGKIVQYQIEFKPFFLLTDWGVWALSQKSCRVLYSMIQDELHPHCTEEKPSRYIECSKWVKMSTLQGLKWCISKVTSNMIRGHTTNHKMVSTW